MTDTTDTNRAPAGAVYKQLGFSSVQAMNHSRRAMQKVWNRDLKRLEPYPDFATSHCAAQAADLQRARDALREAVRAGRRGAALADLEAQQRAARERLSSAVRDLEVAFESVHVLKVPEWGGVKYPKASWTYDRERCEAIAKGS